ncbi:uncharacterized protein LOC114277538 [Camellia sinensis]|uniref:uncharacterized protein LOC114277538 n=1 Tax=Camellia sinensis TaxID=4442 RepID=UPI0010366CF5|nr:uncharacterized protein LOC114277538 [Camellia sinensis]
MEAQQNVGMRMAAKVKIDVDFKRGQKHKIQNCRSPNSEAFFSNPFRSAGTREKGESIGMNISFFTLIPKKVNALNLNDYRPISLIGSMYKLLSKVLASRLKPVLPEVINETQSTFLGGRNILDGVLIANEIMDGWKKAKKKGLLFKLDFEKACDFINWGFLFSILANFGFGSKWISWMKECISTVRISVLVNGSPTKEFSPQKGLRQGDPLSSFLFNLVVKGLNILLLRVRELGLVKGIHIGVNGVVVSYLQFADDSLFCEADVQEVMNLKRILRCFEMVSGLKINFHKCVVCGVGISDSCLKNFASLLNCKTQSLPLKFLGLPLGASPRRKKVWKPVIDKIKSRLAGWKRRLLSFAGRLTLIKSVLSSLPVYYLSLFKMPEGVAKEIDRLQAVFLWEGTELKRKIYLVQWKEVTKSISQGGLGIRKIRKVNDCLLMKRWWRFANENEALWKKVVCNKYKIQAGAWLPNQIVGIRWSKIWGDKLAVAEQRNTILQFFLDNLHIKVGNGCRVRFWQDKWCGGCCLKEGFPRLYSLSTAKNGSLKFFVDNKGTSEMWDLSLRRPLLQWEGKESSKLTNLLRAAPVLFSGEKDKPRWLPCQTGQSFVASLYKHCVLGFGVFESSSRLVWINYLPPKVQFFGWLAWKHKLKTSVFLQRVGVLGEGASILCGFCKSEAESVEHVLVSCPKVWKVLTSLLQWWGILWVVPGSVDCLLYCNSDVGIWAFCKFWHEDLVMWNCCLGLILVKFCIINEGSMIPPLAYMNFNGSSVYIWCESLLGPETDVMLWIVMFCCLWIKAAAGVRSYAVRSDAYFVLLCAVLLCCVVVFKSVPSAVVAASFVLWFVGSSPTGTWSM